MLAIILFTAFLIIRAAPETVAGRALRQGLVDWPAAKLAGLTRGQVACWLAFGLSVWIAIALFGGEAVRLLAMAMPETVAWLAMVDMSVVADAMIVAALAGAHLRLGRLRQALSRPIARRARTRRRRARRRRPAAPANDDQDPARAVAMAA